MGMRGWKRSRSCKLAGTVPESQDTDLSNGVFFNSAGSGHVRSRTLDIIRRTLISWEVERRFNLCCDPPGLSVIVSGKMQIVVGQQYKGEFTELAVGGQTRGRLPGAR